MERPDTTITAVSAPEPVLQIPRDDQNEEVEVPKLRKWVAILTLFISTALVALCAEAMVGSIDSITSGGAVSRTFVGLILLPIVGNAAEHAAAVRVAIKDFPAHHPVYRHVGWTLGKGEMNLAFNGFQVIAFFLAVILVNYLIQDGRVIGM
ncbi:MAG: hypothetical protein Q9221_008515 [Calogaya cf. arnoldii]